ncbi:MAG: glycosyltransferase family 2 protein [Thermomicrobiales bacterium]
MIVYTYAVYPLLVILASRLRRRREPGTGAPLPAVSVLISSHLEEDVIAEKIENTLASTYPKERLQILVAVDTDEDRTADIVRSYAGCGVELSYSPSRQGKSAAIDRAMALASGDIVVFSDANNMYEIDAIERLAQAFDDPDVGVASGAKVISGGDGSLGDSEGLYWRYEDAIKRAESRLSSCTGFVGEILAIRRSLYEPLPSSVLNDDFWIGMSIVRRGYRAVYVPAARSVERVSIDMAAERVRRARIVAGRYQAMRHPVEILPRRNPVVLWQVVSHKFLRPLVPVFMMLAAATNVHLLVRKMDGSSLSDRQRRAFTLAGGGQMLFYAAALIGSKTEPQHRFIRKALYLPTYLASSNLAALSGLVQHYRSKDLHTWQRVERRNGMHTAEERTHGR